MGKSWKSDGDNRSRGDSRNRDISSFPGRFTTVNGSSGGSRVRVKYLPGSPGDMWKCILDHCMKVSRTFSRVPGRSRTFPESGTGFAAERKRFSHCYTHTRHTIIRRVPLSQDFTWTAEQYSFRGSFPVPKTSSEPLLCCFLLLSFFFLLFSFFTMSSFHHLYRLSHRPTFQSFSRINGDGPKRMIFSWTRKVLNYRVEISVVIRYFFL